LRFRHLRLKQGLKRQSEDETLDAVLNCGTGAGRKIRFAAHESGYEEASVNVEIL
jgi:hypothetical protein